MLRQRVITAVVLLLVLIASLAAPGPGWFALLTLVLLAAAGWEWARLNQAGQGVAIAMAAVLAAACGASLAAGWVERAPSFVWWLAVALWVPGSVVALRGGPAAWPRLPQAARWILGLVMLWAAWLAIAHARVVGLNFMFSVFCLVWAADICAYFGGRAFGRRKLAPSVSPGKSWEGVWSGVAGVLLLALAWIAVDRHWSLDGPGLYSRMLDTLGPALAAAALLALVAMSVVGDLVESLVKRAAGAKDSSRLLPGHGGVLDRVDALLPVFPIALALAGV
ncbi:phosphatidate cytidylyltransferase [Rubrivivax gelatinosus]|uniref:Phosphatidate cytidylyltransferase n=1 Tax=Rubrivivax gelatinosus (strain NBRC 100245 / IL144) TaxID=983917 RepID=I0HST6_RUBGI|nr:phosphatidate cytidylyltransferase [Rubrivivax gelatinosus]BAL96073.1 phosphatidate cytidylyltransferase CdsA [Rubrivivax gelatinosus IL144]